MKTVTLKTGEKLPVMGQGTWHFGEKTEARGDEVAALRAGLDLGMTVIDTAEMYAEGGAEEVVGEAIAGRRDEVFLVSKFYPRNASAAELPQACERSLRRLKVETLDLYLLHWRGHVPLEETVTALGQLRRSGKIKRWGVSNFDLADMKELAAEGCVANQVLYNLHERGIEFDLLPWCREHDVLVMAYSPLGQGGAALQNPALAAVAERHNATPAQVALAWTVRQSGILAIPKAGSVAHVQENAAAAAIKFSEQDSAELDAAFPPPTRKTPLSII